MITAQTHACSKAQSYQNLSEARKKAQAGHGFSSEKTRADIVLEFTARFGKAPYEWQVDVTEALILGLDSVVIAGTGFGKTMPFMMALLKDRKAKTVIISPLKVLQQDQVRRFRKMGISAVAVNGDTWSNQLKSNLEHGQYQAIFTSPEMCLQHPQFRGFLSDAVIANDIVMIVIDEAHCISQWGGEFRKEYSQLDKLRVFFPTHVPFLITSATLTPAVLVEIQAQLDFELDDTFFLNLGNDRPNIKMSIQAVKTPADYDAVIPLLTHSGHLPQTREDLCKTIVFVNKVPSSQHCSRYIKSLFLPELRQYVDVLHAYRTRRTKRRLMKQFRKGNILVLVATEAAGMGADIPDIEQVLQLGVPQSLAVWVQRAGRAGRSPNINARAILLVEQAVFQRRRKSSKQKNQESQLADEASDADSGGESDGDTDREELETVKKVETPLMKWVEARECRRDVLDDHFSNPPGRKAPTNGCCDNCSMPTDSQPTTPPGSLPCSRPATPEGQQPPHTHSTPSRNVNINGKRQMESRPPPARRPKAQADAARSALIAWRYDIKRCFYSPSGYTAEAVLPTRFLNALATQRHISSLHTLEQHVKAEWVLGQDHFDDAFSIVRRIDDAEKTRQDEVKRQKMLDEARKQEEKAEKQRAREEAKATAARQKEERARERAAEKARKDAQKAAERRARQVERQAKIPPATPLGLKAGLGHFVATPATTSSAGYLTPVSQPIESGMMHTVSVLYYGPCKANRHHK
ncbi:hypothetical protein EST38_g10098 [Candolleomyces aberdarensis]|uniref:DNA 3'-5' helicase n=1 Tax=Candolleomyces aberdarensis TaxID=2316362 RepID=A0A4Q2DAP4_9AGAR|nr:hypothetical protein EST38_g10098 [Candolleomyces aberdarensis]